MRFIFSILYFFSLFFIRYIPFCDNSKFTKLLQVYNDLCNIGIFSFLMDIRSKFTYQFAMSL